VKPCAETRHERGDLNIRRKTEKKKKKCPMSSEKKKRGIGKPKQKKPIGLSNSLLRRSGEGQKSPTPRNIARIPPVQTGPLGPPEATKTWRLHVGQGTTPSEEGVRGRPREVRRTNSHHNGRRGGPIDLDLLSEGREYNNNNGGSEGGTDLSFLKGELDNVKRRG